MSHTRSTSTPASNSPYPVNAMNDSDVDPETSHAPESSDDLLSLDAEVRECLEDYYARIEFLEETSAAIHDHLQHDYHTASNLRDEDEVGPDTGNGDNQNSYDDNFHGGDADAECHDDFQEEFEDGGDDYEDWDGNDEYHD